MTALLHKLCLFAHFDPQGRVWPHVRHYLEQVRRCGFDIVLIQAGAPLLDADRTAVEAISVRVIERPNGGLDFGSWAAAIHILEAEGALSSVDWLLLANDSVYGPFADLQPILTTMTSGTADVWGLVDSREKSWHLQSWFLCLSRPAFTSATFRDLMRLPFETLDKRTIIAEGERRLAAALAADGFRTAVWSPVDAHRLWPGLTPHNPMHIPWRFMLEQAGVPFVKVELLRDNPLNVRSAVGWKPVLATLSPSMVADIEAHLAARRPDAATPSGYATPLDPISLRRHVYRFVVRISAHVAWRLFGRRLARRSRAGLSS